MRNDGEDRDRDEGNSAVQCAGTAGAWKLRRDGGSNGTAGPLHASGRRPYKRHAASLPPPFTPRLPFFLLT